MTNNYTLTTEEEKQLEEKIRDIIPGDESRELKFGCLAKENGQQGWGKLCVIGNHQEIAHCDEGEIYCKYGRDHYVGECCFKISTLNIIGRPLTIVDVLVALGDRFAINGEGWFFERKTMTDEYDGNGLRFFLTKPYDAPENAEARAFIYSMLF